MKSTLQLQLTRTLFDTNYIPKPNSRNTTNLVNLTRDPEKRESNIKLLFSLINSRLNNLLTESNINKDRYRVSIEILTTWAKFYECDFELFPISEMLHATVLDSKTNTVLDGPYGFNLSSYIRDYDFNVILPKILKDKTAEENGTFGSLHGILYQLQFKDFSSLGILNFPAITAISVSSNKIYCRSDKVHPILGIEYYEVGERSSTSLYFQKMGLDVTYYMSEGMVAPLAYYHRKNDLETRDKLHLVLLISVMDTIQKIYRPEIYAAKEAAGVTFTPSLNNREFTKPQIDYDRNERDQILTEQQSMYVQTNFLMPYQQQLKQLVQEYSHDGNG